MKIPSLIIAYKKGTQNGYNISSAEKQIRNVGKIMYSI